MKEESCPVRRRRRFKNRRSCGTEPEESFPPVLLPSSSSSSEEDDNDEVWRKHLRGASARGVQREVHRSMNCLSLPPLLHLQPSQRSLSMADVDGLDFASEASVSRWTSRMLAELASLPCSQSDLSTAPAGRSPSLPSSTEADSDDHTLSLSSLHTIKCEEPSSSTPNDASIPSPHSPALSSPQVRPPSSVLSIQPSPQDSLLFQSISRLGQRTSQLGTMESCEERNLERWQRDMESRGASSSRAERECSPPSVDDVARLLSAALSSSLSPKQPRKDVETQTTPPLARSSSFHWVASHPTCDEEEMKEDEGETSTGDEEDREVCVLNHGRGVDDRMESSLAMLINLANGNEFESVRRERKKRRRRKDSQPRKTSLNEKALPARQHSSTMSESVYENVEWSDSADSDRLVQKGSSAGKGSGALPSLPSNDASQSVTEALAWLKEHSFSHYVRSFEEGRFPLPPLLSDHSPSLSSSEFKELSRRIDTLNSHARMRVERLRAREYTGWVDVEPGDGRREGPEGAAPSSLPPLPLQRCHSERMKERAKTIIKRMDVRRRGSRHTEEIGRRQGGQFSESVVSPQRMKLFNEDTPSPSTSSDRRGGLIVASPSSFSSSDESSSLLRLSRYGECAPSRSLVGRDRSVPSRHREQRTRKEMLHVHEYLFPSRTRGTASLYGSGGSGKELDGVSLYATPPHTRRLLIHRVVHPCPGSPPDVQPFHSSTLRARQDGELCGGRRDSGLAPSLSPSPSVGASVRVRQSLLLPSLPLSSSLSSSISSCSSASTKRLHSVSLKESCDLFIPHALLPHCIDALSVTDCAEHRRVAYARVSAAMEKWMGGSEWLPPLESDDLHTPHYSSTWNSTVHRLIKKFKGAQDEKILRDERGNIFGVCLSSIRRSSSLALPHSILEILRFLRSLSCDTVGLFRKNGVKSRIADIRRIADCESEKDVFVGENALSPAQVHDVADVLKQYLRELPEPLMTNKWSSLFINIAHHLPESERVAATSTALHLLPLEHREALQTILLFLSQVASHSATNSMTCDNLSVCLAPSLFRLSAARLNTQITTSRRHKTIGGIGMPSESEMKETRAAQKSLSLMIAHAQTLFVVEEHSLDVLSSAPSDVPPLKLLGGAVGPRMFLQRQLLEMVEEGADRWRGWIVEGRTEGVEMSSRKCCDGVPIKRYRVWTDVDAPPKQVLRRILRERYIWDPTLINYRLMETLGPDWEIFQYVLNDTVGHPTRDFFVVRMFREVSSVRGGYAVVERSVECSETQLLGGISAVVHENNFLIHTHEGRSRVTHISRVDLRGRPPSWYSSHYPFIVARQLARLRHSFKLPLHDSPETKV